MLNIEYMLIKLCYYYDNEKYAIVIIIIIYILTLSSCFYFIVNIAYTNIYNVTQYIYKYVCIYIYIKLW